MSNDETDTMTNLRKLLVNYMQEGKGLKAQSADMHQLFQDKIIAFFMDKKKKIEKDKHKMTHAMKT